MRSAEVPVSASWIRWVSLSPPQRSTRAAIIGYATEQGGKPEATAIGAPSRLPAALATLVNGTLAHSLDYDDTHLPSIVHPSATVVPALLAAAEAYDATGRSMVDAVAVGLEICSRLGMVGYDYRRS